MEFAISVNILYMKDIIQFFIEGISLLITVIFAVIPYFRDKNEKKENFKIQLENSNIVLLFKEFSSNIDGKLVLFKSTLDAINYKQGEPYSQYYGNKSEELKKHPEWFAKNLKEFKIQSPIWKYKKYIKKAIEKESSDGDKLINDMVENAKRLPGRISVLV